MSIRVRIAIETQKVNANINTMSIDLLAPGLDGKRWTVCILVRIEQDIGSIVFVVALSMRNVSQIHINHCLIGK